MRWEVGGELVEEVMGGATSWGLFRRDYGGKTVRAVRKDNSGRDSEIERMTAGWKRRETMKLEVKMRDWQVG